MTANRTGALLAAGFAALALAVGWFATRADEALRETRVPRAADRAQPTQDAVLASDLEPAAPRVAQREAAPAEFGVTPPLPGRSAVVSDLRLVPVRVRAVDGDGSSPMPGMVVELWDGVGNPRPEDPSVSRARTDGQGVAAFEIARPRKSSVTLAARVAQHGWSSPIARATVPPDDASRPGDGSRREPVELVLHPELGCVVHGLVFDGDSARASAGYVEVHFPGDSKTRPVEDGEHERYPLAGDGIFELRLPVGRTAVLRAVLPNGATGERELEPERSTPLVYLTLNAYPRGGISGRLVDLAGRALPRFRVHAVQRSTRATDGAFQRSSRHNAETGLDGRFAFEGERARPTLLETSSPNGSTARLWPLAENLTPSAVQDVTYTLPLTRITVSARDDRGEPLELLHAKGSEPSFGVLRGRAGVFAESSEDGGWIHYLGSLPPAEERGRRTLSFHGEVLLLDPDAPPVRQLVFLAEAGHDYGFALRSWGHEAVDEQVWVGYSGEDVEIELQPSSLGAPVDVEFVLLEASGELFPGRANWVLSTRRASWPAVAWLPSTYGEPAAVALPPGTYTVDVEFPTGNELAGPAWGLNREVTISPDGPRRFELQVPEAEVRQAPRPQFGW